MTNRRHPIKQLSKPSVPLKRTLATFKATHDLDTVIPNKIRKALDRMVKEHGPEFFMYEVKDNDGGPTFSKYADVGGNYLSKYRPLFAGYIVVAPGATGTRRAARCLWFATPKAAEAARAIVGTLPIDTDSE